MAVLNLPIESYVKSKEGLYYDRKSARIKPDDIVRHIIAFANANGGILAIGIEDDNSLTGFNSFPSKPNAKVYSPDDYKDIIFKECIPYPPIAFKTLQFGKNENDFLFLIFVDSSSNEVIRKKSTSDVYLRMGDQSQRLTHEQITQLEYDKGQRYFEDQIIQEATYDDLDEAIIQKYKDKMEIVSDRSLNDLLVARGLIQKNKITNAAILLFGKNPTQFLPNARVRFLRYDGKKSLTGERINVIKEKTFDDAIPNLIIKVTDFVRSQLREFQMLDKDGQFKVIPEYPEFAWFEGIVNAVLHRDYRVRGDHIRISMYDDRLEIFSPGKLPNTVTLETMKCRRFSRNPRIARILTEFGWVKELNEGVNRIYDEMQRFFLNEPKYSEPNNLSVQLVLENSITSRHLRAKDKLESAFSETIWDSLSSQERNILQYLYLKGKTSTKDASDYLRLSTVTTRKILKNLALKNLIIWHGVSNNDPNQYYTLNIQTFE